MPPTHVSVPHYIFKTSRQEKLFGEIQNSFFYVIGGAGMF